MKKLLAIIFLNFSFIIPSQADNIKEFQIEGINIGDSLLDYFSLSQLKDLADHKSTFSYPKTKAKIIRTHRDVPLRESEKKSSTYAFVGVTIFDEVDYKIIGIQGYIRFKNIDDCNKKRLEVEKVIENTLNKKPRREIKKHAYDKVSTSYNSWFSFDNEESISVNCTDWQNKSNEGWMPNLKVSIASSKLIEVLKKNFN